MGENMRALRWWCRVEVSDLDCDVQKRVSASGMKT